MKPKHTYASERAELMAALSGAPWAITEEYLLAFARLVSPFMVQGEGIEAIIAAAAPRRAVATGDSIAVLNLSGVITPKPSFFSMLFGGTAMTDFMAELDAAVASTKAAGILMNVDSPGGMVDLVPEAAAAIRAARKVKPVVAVANTTAASAAYWLAAQADELVVTPSGTVGSIGVYSAHTDYSAAEEQAGMKTTLISAGKYKVEGNPYEPLAEDAQAAMQDKVDTFYGMFTADVAKGRAVPVASVRDGYGQGRMLTAQAAKDAGMVDRIDTIDGVISSMMKSISVGAKAEETSPQLSALNEAARFEYIRFGQS